MNKFLLPIFSLFFIFAITFQSFAQEDESESIPINKPSIAIAPHFFAEENIRIQTNLIGDTFIIGQNVDIQETIDGDLFVIAEKLSINAPINGNLRVITTRVEIRSIIEGSFGFIASNVYIPGTGEIEKDAYGIAEQFNLEGRIGRDLNLGYSPDTNSRIDGKILGNFSYTTSRPNITERANIEGVIERIEHNFDTQIDDYRRIQTVTFKLIHSLSLILIGLLIFKLKGDFFRKHYKNYKISFFKMLFAGSITLLVAPLLLLLLLVSVIGIPLALIIISIILSALYLSPIFAATWIGQKIFNAKEPRAIDLIIGILIIDIITLSPFIGPFISMVIGLSFLGLIVRLLTLKNA